MGIPTVLRADLSQTEYDSASKDNFIGFPRKRQQICRAENSSNTNKCSHFSIFPGACWMLILLLVDSVKIAVDVVSIREYVQSTFEWGKLVGKLAKAANRQSGKLNYIWYMELFLIACVRRVLVGGQFVMSSMENKWVIIFFCWKRIRWWTLFLF